MAVTYTWAINPLECYPTSSEGSNYVFLAHWQLNATETVNGTLYSDNCIGAELVSGSASGSFIPFENLTEEIVQRWVEEAMGVEEVNAMKAAMAQNIANQINPPVVTLQSPWLKN